MTQKLADRHTVSSGDRILGFLGPVSTGFTLCWLARHRGRLRTFVAGGKYLSVLVIWDRNGSLPPPKPTQREIDAVRVLAFGEPEGVGCRLEMRTEYEVNWIGLVDGQEGTLHAPDLETARKWAANYNDHVLLKSSVRYRQVGEWIDVPLENDPGKG